MHDDYLLEEATKNIKKQAEADEYRRKNQNTFGVPVEKDFVIPISQPLGVSTSINNYKKNNETVKVELPTNLNEAINNLNEAQKTKNIDSKVVDATKKITANQTVNYNPTYKTDVTINESKDGKNGFEDIVKVLIEKDKENLERIKAQAGMGFLF